MSHSNNSSVEIDKFLLDHAKLILSNPYSTLTTFTVATLSDMIAIGIPDETHLMRLFKHKFGCSRSDFRYAYAKLTKGLNGQDFNLIVTTNNKGEKIVSRVIVPNVDGGIGMVGTLETKEDIDVKSSKELTRLINESIVKIANAQTSSELITIVNNSGINEIRFHELFIKRMGCTINEFRYRRNLPGVPRITKVESISSHYLFKDKDSSIRLDSSFIKKLTGFKGEILNIDIISEDVLHCEQKDIVARCIVTKCDDGSWLLKSEISIGEGVVGSNIHGVNVKYDMDIAIHENNDESSDSTKTNIEDQRKPFYHVSSDSEETFNLSELPDPLDKLIYSMLEVGTFDHVIRNRPLTIKCSDKRMFEYLLYNTNIVVCELHDGNYSFYIKESEYLDRDVLIINEVIEMSLKSDRDNFVNSKQDTSPQSIVTPKRSFSHQHPKTNMDYGRASIISEVINLIRTIRTNRTRGQSAYRALNKLICANNVNRQQLISFGVLSADLKTQVKQLVFIKEHLTAALKHESFMGTHLLPHEIKHIKLISMTSDQVDELLSKETIGSIDYNFYLMYKTLFNCN